MPDGRFTVPTWIYLDPAQRAKLDYLVQDEGVDVPQLLSELLVQHLAALPDPPPPALRENTGAAELKARRIELRRIRARTTQSDDPAPAWLVSYIADLEQEIVQLERMQDEG